MAIIFCSAVLQAEAQHGDDPDIAPAVIEHSADQTTVAPGSGADVHAATPQTSLRGAARGAGTEASAEGGAVEGIREGADDDTAPESTALPAPHASEGPMSALFASTEQPASPQSSADVVAPRSSFGSGAAGRMRAGAQLEDYRGIAPAAQELPAAHASTTPRTNATLLAAPQPASVQGAVDGAEPETPTGDVAAEGLAQVTVSVGAFAAAGATHSIAPGCITACTIATRGVPPHAVPWGTTSTLATARGRFDGSANCMW
eukprot:CAMPEP_0170213388 /NCGR_PEP_ID=MMETSP0116_2-20130129/6318_1 /TAXON_ID=400756 /ORGANISM="Durinskia baltica, Strain CSIRO CS-38" /LENGTH=259 /DNA_ID=CAMNT_0010463939 /DNA_START=58 /DNA_END=835 /DNA_ORIENTATION=+